MKKQKINKYAQDIQAELDLHGMIRSEANRSIDDFLDDSVEKGFKKVLIITGKGLHSKDGEVLRSLCVRILKDRGISFKNAKYNQGGQGAIEIDLIDDI
ncbi:MAG: Smr/MutS family protein [Candidatus Gracilibacteria bacterium]|jgi:DNA-nicking Smr family endonuclease|nr:Smr/MutS family protein [Candidatus Gracilibacteria bacterium]